MRGPTIGVLAVLVIMIAGCGQIPSGEGAPTSVADADRPPARRASADRTALSHARHPDRRVGPADLTPDRGSPTTAELPGRRSRTGCP